MGMKNFFLGFILLFVSSAVCAVDINEIEFEDEGRLAAKLRVFGAIPNSKQHNLPELDLPNPAENEDLISKGGGGIEFVTEVFFTDHIATELAIGLGAYNTNKITNIAANYKNKDDKNAAALDPKILAFIPVSFLAKYFIAPFGAISPYVGVGYKYNFIFTMSKEFSVSNTHSPLLQFGVDFVSRDDTVYSLDIKKLYQQPIVTYSEDVIKKVEDKLVTSNLTNFHPWIISLGVGWKF